MGSRFKLNYPESIPSIPLEVWGKIPIEFHQWGRGGGGEAQEGEGGGRYFQASTRFVVRLRISTISTQISHLLLSIKASKLQDIGTIEVTLNAWLVYFLFCDVTAI